MTVARGTCAARHLGARLTTPPNGGIRRWGSGSCSRTHLSKHNHERPREGVQREPGPVGNARENDNHKQGRNTIHVTSGASAKAACPRRSLAIEGLP
jgi:hypothetical protein